MEIILAIIAAVCFGLNLHQRYTGNRERLIAALTEQAVALFMNAEKELKTSTGTKKFEAVKEQLTASADQVALDIVADTVGGDVDVWLQSVYDKAKGTAIDKLLKAKPKARAKKKNEKKE